MSYLVTVSRQLGGTVTADDGKINCGSAPSATLCGPVAYPWAQSVTLVATADPGKMFGTWAGDCIGRTKIDGRYACVLDTKSTGADKYVVPVFGEPGQALHPNFTPLIGSDGKYLTGIETTHGAEFLNWVAKQPDSFECTHCHGGSYDGLGVALSCNKCHAGSGVPNWRNDCNFCHAAPPAAPHPAVSSELTGCATCHSDTVALDGKILADGNHMNGSVQASGGHADWTSVEIHGPKYFDYVAGIAATPDCKGCHGPTYEAVVNAAGESCGNCHSGAGWSSWETNCSFCHGEKNPQSQLGVYDLAVNPMWSAPATGAHEAHLVRARFAAPLPCAACHTVPQDTTHIGGATARATVTLASGSYDAGTGTCSTSCHGAGSSPAWSTTGLQCGACHGIPPATTVHAGKTIADCSNCHSETMANGSLIPGGKHIDGIVQKSGGHSDYTSPTVHGPKFFGFIAGEGGECRNCHGATDDGGFGPSCNDCHEGQSWTAWQTNCSFCHGEKNAQSQLGGYSLGVNPMWSAPATGAHQAHLVGGHFARGFKCETCHTVPLDLSHIGGSAARAEVALSGAGQASFPAALGEYQPGAAAVDATCSTYCHGTAAPSPAWSTTALECGGCHALPPADGHPAVSGGLASCSTCHPTTVNADGTLHLAGGAHIDGVVQAEREHAAGYGAPAAHGPDFLAYLAAGQPASGCKSCHGQSYEGGSAPSCNDCHSSPTVGWTNWQTNCSFCHGTRNATTKAGYSVTANPTWSAPPDTVDQRLDGIARPALAGAHQAHLTGAILGRVYSAPFECATCHTVPTGLSHVSGTGATVVLDRAGRTTLPQNLGTYNANSSCTTYCHGATFVDYDGNAVPAPTWGQKFLEWDCSKCHGYPPASGPTITDDWYCYWRPDDTCHVHQIHQSCDDCHPPTSGFANTHVNGKVEVTPRGGTYEPVTGCSSTPYGCHGYTRPWQ